MLDHIDGVLKRGFVEHSAAFKKFSNKLEDGLGVEIYFYPSVPVRVGDLLSEGIKEAYGTSLSLEEVANTAGKWTLLIAELLQLRYMPYVPWHHGLGSCVDYGNACLDGGFNDLLTLSSFDAIPSQALMRRSLSATIGGFADTIVAYCNAAAGGRGLASPSSDAHATAQLFATGQIREHLREMRVKGRHIDDRLMAFLAQPSTTDIVTVLREEHLYRDRRPQYVYDRVPEVAES